MPEFPHNVMVLWTALALDFLLGEPPNSIHPVAWMGRLISVFYRRASKVGRVWPLLGGAAFAITGMIVIAMLALLAQNWLNTLAVPWEVLLEAVALKLTFSINGLARAGRIVRSALEGGDLSMARNLTSQHLVSRDTTTLSEPQVAAAAIESVSENASDSLVAPLFYYALFGLPGAYVYRFINTCDAMLGYRDPEREWLGKAAARLDDLANLVPARLTAALIVVSGMIFGRNPAKATRIWFRDRKLTASPNAGHPMSAAAGVLDVELEKFGHYRLGSGQRRPGPADIRQAERLLWCTAAAASIVFSVVLCSLA